MPGVYILPYYRVYTSADVQKITPLLSFILEAKGKDHQLIETTQLYIERELHEFILLHTKTTSINSFTKWRKSSSYTQNFLIEYVL